MGKVKSVQYNFIMNFILTASNLIFPLITFPYVSRILGAVGNGKITFITAIASYFSMVASLGIPTYGIRACAAVRDDKDKLSKTAHELIMIHSIMTVISLGFFFVSMVFIERLAQETELMLINALGLVLNVVGVNWLYSALEQYQYITVRSIFFKLISVFLMFGFIHQKEDYIVYGAITVFAVAGSNVLNFINAKKHIYWKRYQNYQLRKHMGPIFMFFAQSVAITVYTNLDTVMLGFMKDDRAVGLYSAAIRVKGILVSLVTSLGTVLLPRLSYYVHNNKFEEFKKMIHKAVEFVLLISLPLTMYFIVMAEETILLLSGEDFIDATLAMQIIIPTIVFIGLSNITGIQFLTPLGKENYVLVSVIVGAIVDMILNILFIPTMGAAGASLGTLIAEIAVLIVQTVLIKKKYDYHFFEMKKMYQYLVLIITGGIPLYLFQRNVETGIFLELVISAMLFFGIYLVMCIMMKVEFVNDFVDKMNNKLRR